MSDQQPDPRPGYYYVSVIDGPRIARAFGPFVNDHAAALVDVDRVRELASERYPRTHFYAFGTCRCETDHGPGALGSPDQSTLKDFEEGLAQLLADEGLIGDVRAAALSVLASAVRMAKWYDGGELGTELALRIQSHVDRDADMQNGMAELLQRFREIEARRKARAAVAS